MRMLYSIIALIPVLLLFFIGLIGNGLLIFIVFRQKHLRTVPNLLVVSLAFGDFLFVLFCVPFGAVAYAFEYYPFSEFYCRFENFIINLSLGVSVFSLLALSADRYKVIAKPFSCHANDPSIKLKLVVIFIWFLSALLALPETIYSGLITDTVNETNTTAIQFVSCWSPNKMSLLENPTFMITRQSLRSIIYYLMPLIFISIFYSLIAKTLFQTKDVIYSKISSSCSLKNKETCSVNIRHSREISSSNNNNNNNSTTNRLIQDARTRKQLRARHKVAKTVLLLCLVFFLCWLPKQLHDLYWFIGVLVYSSDWNHFWQINKTIALILTYIYSCINPFALYFLSSTFRHFYKRYLCFWLHTTCCSNQRSTKRQSRGHMQDITITSNEQQHSSLNDANTTIYYELNRMKSSTLREV